MRMLIVLRHGKYFRERINEDGRRQMEGIAKTIRPLMEGLSVLVLSSTATRASDSAEAFCAALGVDGFEPHQLLWSDEDHWEDYPAVMELVQAKGSDVEVLILVTHLEYAQRFPAFFASESGISKTIPRLRLDYGEAIVLDCETGAVQRLFPGV